MTNYVNIGCISSENDELFASMLDLSSLMENIVVLKNKLEVFV